MPQVFAMNNMFAALLLLLILRFNERRSLALACAGTPTYEGVFLMSVEPLWG